MAQPDLRPWPLDPAEGFRSRNRSANATVAQYAHTVYDDTQQKQFDSLTGDALYCGCRKFCLLKNIYIIIIIIIFFSCRFFLQIPVKFQIEQYTGSTSQSLSKREI